MTAEKRAKKPTVDANIAKHTPAICHAPTPPRTPTAVTTAAHELFSEVRDIYDHLSTLPNLAPGEQINALLTRLVGLCIVPYSAEFTKSFFSTVEIDQLCEQLRPICAAAEGELEKYWATQIIDSARRGMNTPELFLNLTKLISCSLKPRT